MKKKLISFLLSITLISQISMVLQMMPTLAALLPELADNISKLESLTEKFGLDCPYDYIESDEFKQSLAESTKILTDQSTVLELPDKTTMYAGDIHGDSKAVGRVLTHFANLLKQGVDVQLIFTGDYDGGNNIIPTIYLLTRAHIWFPDRIFLLKGNHESKRFFDVSNADPDYDTEEFDLTNILPPWYGQLPLVATVGGNTVACHGSWDYRINSPAVLHGLRKRNVEITDSIEYAMTWSFPQNFRHYGSLKNNDYTMYDFSDPTDTCGYLHILDSKMQVMGSIYIAKLLRRIYPDCRVLIGGHNHDMSGCEQEFEVDGSPFKMAKTICSCSIRTGKGRGQRVTRVANPYCFLVQQNGNPLAIEKVRVFPPSES
ncbi:MAG: metallophosphoesterase [Oscillospiraceae bacterium]|jgi:hypothetical protein|nr:metallophosphoesterase [Oscillospiraceae bacterium]